MENIATKSQQETGYEMDAELKHIMGSRYEDWSDKFTPEAQQERRNNRLRFTLQLVGFILILMFFVNWAERMGLMSSAWATLLRCVGGFTTGYNVAVCVCHNKGWRGA